MLLVLCCALGFLLAAAPALILTFEIVPPSYLTEREWERRVERLTRPPRRWL